MLAIGIAALPLLRSSSIGVSTCLTARIGVNRANWRLTMRLIHCRVNWASGVGRHRLTTLVTSVSGLVTDVREIIVVILGLLDVMNRYVLVLIERLMSVTWVGLMLGVECSYLRLVWMLLVKDGTEVMETLLSSLRFSVLRSSIPSLSLCTMLVIGSTLSVRLFYLRTIRVVGLGLLDLNY